MSDSSRASEKSERRRNVVVAFLLLLFLAAGASGLVYYARERSAQIAYDEAPSIPKLPTPESPKGSYVGSEKCASCHQAVAEKYAAHPMAHSMADVKDATRIEDFDLTLVAAETPQKYRVERNGDEVLHHEAMIDDKGNAVYDQAESVQYAIGSGRRERFYLLEREGLMLQSPITWQATEKRWRLAHSYGEGTNFRFERRIGDDCLFCHSGRTSNEEYGENRYDKKPFHEVAIGCERCHGPGDAHVKKQSANPAPGEPDDSIVNPSRLDDQHREHVCYQCHLQGNHRIPRYGQQLSNFRPGQLMDDVFVVMAPSPQTEDEYRAVSHVTQIRASECFMGSKGKFGCTSCHDPHSTPEPANKVAYYNDRCNACHVDSGCKEQESARNAAPANGSCIHCHMPKQEGSVRHHYVLTDHRVRVVGRQPEEPPGDRSPFRVRMFDRSDQRLPERETQRIRGLALMADGLASQQPKLAKQASELLLPESVEIERGLRDIGDDVPVLNALGSYFALIQQERLAIRCWNEALAHSPKNEATMGWIVRTAYGSGDFKTSLTFLDELLKINPTLAAMHTRRAMILDSLDRRDEALEAAETALKLNPSIITLREWLVRSLDDPEKKAEQQKIVDDLKKLGLE